MITFPCMKPILVSTSKIISNDYNPNLVATAEMELLALSIRESGLTQPIVTFYDSEIDIYIVIDGFHRYVILKSRFMCQKIPVVVIEGNIKQRMASTIRHNRARGKHQVVSMSDLICDMMELGWTGQQVAYELGMEMEEVLRLQQVNGVISPVDISTVPERNGTKGKVKFPCLNPVLVSVKRIEANNYNPNVVKHPEMKLLAHSIKQDGVTQPVVVWYDKNRDMYIVVDGFHRFTLLAFRLKCQKIPVTVIDGDMKQRMASTVRHNRARGKHQVNLMEVMVNKLTALGWKNTAIAKHLGMRAEEILRMKQERGIAQYYAHRKYSRAWIWVKDEY